MIQLKRINNLQIQHEQNSFVTLLVCHTKALDDLDYVTGVIWTILLIHDAFLLFWYLAAPVLIHFQDTDK